MRNLVEYLNESIMDDDTVVVNSTVVNTSISLILSDKATKKDLDTLKDKVAIWKPKNRDELKGVVDHCVKIDPKCSLNWIDVSGITSMREMFNNSIFNGDISKWDVSKVENMFYAFYYSVFTGDISKWDVSKVKYMYGMFEGSDFDGDISKWNVSKVEDMCNMFSLSDFNKDISKWNVSNVEDMENMFYQSKFNRDISNWNIKDRCNVRHMFKNCYIKKEYKPKRLQ